MTSDISAPDIFIALKDKDLVPLISVMTKVLNNFWVISAPSWSAEDSFSGLRRLKPYLRSTIGQSQLSSLALMQIDHWYVNRVFKQYIQKIIDVFGQRKGRKDYVA